MTPGSGEPVQPEAVWRTLGVEALGQMIDALPTPLLYTDQDGATLLNAAARSVFGLPANAPGSAETAIIQASGLQLRPGDLLAREGSTHDLRIGDRCYTVVATPLVSTGRATGVWSLHDVTALRAAEQARLQAKRTAILAQTSASLGHDLNNLLARIICRAEDLQGPSAPPETHAVAEALILDAEKAADLVRRQAICGDMSPARLAPTDLGPLVEDWRDRQAEAPQRLVEAVEGRALMDADLFRIVLDALTANAVQAGATRIVVSQPASQEEGAVLIRIEDNGPGMTADILARSCAPFFTTSPSGAGLGLTMARRAMLLLGGDLSLTSPPGKGLTIILRLRRAVPGATS